MKSFIGGLLYLGFLVNGYAETAQHLFKDSDIKVGKILYEKNQCASCHIKMMGGVESALYTRKNRIVQNPKQLISQVALCNTRLNASLFPEEERDIAAFLNKEYYKFK